MVRRAGVVVEYSVLLRAKEEEGGRRLGSFFGVCFIPHGFRKARDGKGAERERGSVRCKT